jgi:hypothetical protein
MEEMNRQCIEKILTKMRSDNSFAEKILKINSSQDLNESIKKLKNDGIDATEKDLLDTVNVIGLIDKYGKYEKIEEFDLGQELRKGLIDVIKQIGDGYERTMKMYTVAFYLGIGLILISVVSSLLTQSEMNNLILGGLGMADVIATLIFKPAQSLQESRSNLAQLQAAFVNWINDIYNWNRYLENIDDNAKSNNQSITFDQVSPVSDKLINNTEIMMKMIRNYILTPISKEKSSDIKE